MIFYSQSNQFSLIMSVPIRAKHGRVFHTFLPSMSAGNGLPAPMSQPKILIQEVAKMSNEIKSLKSLKERAKEFSVRLPFMEGRDKGETKELVGTVNTITEYGFLPNDKGEVYVAFIVKEREKKFYFGGQVLTDQMGQLEAEGYHDAIVEEGLPFLMTEKRSKNGRTYSNIEFYPE